MRTGVEMAKVFPNEDWHLADANGNIATWQHVQIAVLMDIRRELQQLNRTLSCHRVPSSMDALHRIDRRLQKKIPLK
jgi:hypothetical protein